MVGPERTCVEPHHLRLSIRPALPSPSCHLARLAPSLPPFHSLRVSGLPKARLVYSRVRRHLLKLPINGYLHRDPLLDPVKISASHRMAVGLVSVRHVDLTQTRIKQ
jgi:hypothetical protein